MISDQRPKEGEEQNLLEREHTIQEDHQASRPRGKKVLAVFEKEQREAYGWRKVCRRRVVRKREKTGQGAWLQIRALGLNGLVK